MDKIVEHFYPELIPISPHANPPSNDQGTFKVYFMRKQKSIQRDMVVVSIIPCTAKIRMQPSEMNDSGEDVDYVLQQGELAKMIKQAKLICEPPDRHYDDHGRVYRSSNYLWATR